MKRIFITAMLIGAFSLTVSVVQAQNVLIRGPISFATYDANDNGIISEQEFNTIREQRQAAVKNSGRTGRGMTNAPTFTAIDTDKDGQISEQELRVMQQQQQANRGMGRGRGSSK